jgi:hypothetical protein
MFNKAAKEIEELALGQKYLLGIKNFVNAAIYMYVLISVRSILVNWTYEGIGPWKWNQLFQIKSIIIFLKNVIRKVGNSLVMAMPPPYTGKIYAQKIQQ